MLCSPGTAGSVPPTGGGFGALGEQFIDAGQRRSPVRPETPGVDFGAQPAQLFVGPSGVDLVEHEPDRHVRRVTHVAEGSR